MMDPSPITKEPQELFILAVDPGVQTGVALLNPEGEIVWTLTCEDPYEELESSLSHYVDADVVLESAPNTRHYQAVFRSVLALCEDREVHFISPSEWKNHPFCQVSGLATKHEAEAVGIGRAYLLRRKREQRSAGAGSHRVDPKPSGHIRNGAGTVSDL